MQNNEIIKPAKYFSELEKSILLALVEKYKYVLECKKSDARTIALKQRTWQALAHEYNSQPKSFAVSNRELCDDEKEFIHFPLCEGTSQPEPSCSAGRMTASKNYRSKTSQEGAIKKMHEEEHHQQMSILQLQLIQMNEVHVAKIQQIERECEMAEEEHRIKMEVLNKKKMYWERKLQTFTKEWPVSSFNRPFPNSP
ncbi:myb/SANT-like DNA-binding domain-containing protein 3 [Orycteropus afer afer]|uniref:Myb/SANT-like DNA-binding domain-containing protein 3 n=1 Tax=Orycteropus afer afer TaxID=1230840 RepID=A0A8B7AL09_ORYAF|nr:myb/SANT-like DNA-binding domain-containing protein 3 [Orycteropus afer afer]